MRIFYLPTENLKEKNKKKIDEKKEHDKIHKNKKKQ